MCNNFISDPLSGDLTRRFTQPRVMNPPTVTNDFPLKTTHYNFYNVDHGDRYVIQDV